MNIQMIITRIIPRTSSSPNRSPISPNSFRRDVNSTNAFTIFAIVPCLSRSDPIILVANSLYSVISTAVIFFGLANPIFSLIPSVLHLFLIIQYILKLIQPRFIIFIYLKKHFLLPYKDFNDLLLKFTLFII